MCILLFQMFIVMQCILCVHAFNATFANSVHDDITHMLTNQWECATKLSSHSNRPRAAKWICSPESLHNWLRFAENYHRLAKTVTYVCKLYYTVTPQTIREFILMLVFSAFSQMAWVCSAFTAYINWTSLMYSLLHSILVPHFTLV